MDTYGTLKERLPVERGPLNRTRPKGGYTAVKALSIYPEPVMDIFMGDKTIEYRTWQTDYRGDLLICGMPVFSADNQLFQ